MHHEGRLSRDRALGLAEALGWFSIGLGALELFAPRTVTRALGMEGKEETVALYGVREIVTGIGILASENPGPWLWGRVGGDALDLFSLAGGAHADNPQRSHVGVAMATVAGIAVVDWVCAEALQETRPATTPPRRVDYARRSGFPQGAHAARGAASDFEIPNDMRTPDLLRPLNQTRH
ncbi:cyclase dehydrase [Prosthecomicrobium sp. N25]|uniref:cyclase dehydrase n=1 Tax=Prosthecomicrobium sp. N25 TaxID=3129254 RepID=UPI003077F004